MAILKVEIVPPKICCSKAGVSNSNSLKGHSHMIMKKVPWAADKRKKCGLQFIEEGSECHIFCQI